MDPVYAVKTWRYLRLAMIALVIGLGVSIAHERGKVHPGCFQTSVSAYYYTPVHSYFVGALVGIAVCLVCLRGSTGTEDVLLNLAGMFAPIVAFVPTPQPGRCASFLEATVGRDETRHLLRRRGDSLKNRYMAIAVAMVVSAVAVAVAAVAGWRYATIAIETAFISLFALFWVVQT